MLLCYYITTFWQERRCSRGTMFAYRIVNASYEPFRKIISTTPCPERVCTISYCSRYWWHGGLPGTLAALRRKFDFFFFFLLLFIFNQLTSWRKFAVQFVFIRLSSSGIGQLYLRLLLFTYFRTRRAADEWCTLTIYLNYIYTLKLGTRVEFGRWDVITSQQPSTVRSRYLAGPQRDRAASVASIPRV